MMIKSTWIKAILSTIAFLLCTYLAGWIYWYAWYVVYLIGEMIFTGGKK